MRVLVQWSRSTARDWDEVDSAAWKHAPKKADPTGTGLTLPLDDAPGWVSALNIQGVTFDGYDYYAVEHVDEETIRVSCWANLPASNPIGKRQACVWTFKTLAPDPNYGGAINTRQTRTLYADGPLAARLQANGVAAEPYDDFVPPADEHVRYGKFLANDDHDKHTKVRREVGWREFTDGVDPAELDANGRVPPQRAIGRYNKPDGTKTYYLDDATLATGAAKASQELASIVSIADVGTVAEEVKKSFSETVFAWTTPSNEPNDAGWPSGVYRCQLDVNAAGADLTYGLLTMGGEPGHFARVDSGLTTESSTEEQTQGAFSGTGQKLATTTTTTFGTAGATDRFENLVACTNSNSSTAQTLTINISDADSFTDGPWPAGETYERSANDTAVAAETLKKEWTAVRSASDTPSVSDTVAAGRDITRLADDTAVVSDQVAAICYCTFLRSADDTAVVAETLVKEHQAARILEETAVVTEQLVTEADYSRLPIEDAAVVADQVAAVCFCEIAVVVNDTVSVAEQAIRAHEAVRDIEETAVVAETVSRSAEFGVILAADSIVVTDQAARELTQSGQLFERELTTDTPVVSDAAAAELQAERTIGESVVVADAIAREMSLARDATDTASVSSTNYGVIVPEITDPVEGSKLSGASVTFYWKGSGDIDLYWLDVQREDDSYIIQTGALANTIKQYLVNDIPTTGETITATLYYRQVGLATWLGPDTAIYQAATLGVADDAVSVSDSVAVSLEADRTATDTAVVADSVEATKIATIERSASDTVTVTEQLVKEHDAVRGPSDTTVVTDQVVVAGDSDVSASDTVNVSDTPSRSATFERTIDDWRGTST